MKVFVDKKIGWVWKRILGFITCTIIAIPINAEKHNENENDFERQLLVESVHILGGFNSRVTRWTEEIRMAVIGDISDTVETNLDALVAQLSMYTGLTIKRVGHSFKNASEYLIAIEQSPLHDLSLCSVSTSSECANFVIVVTSKPVMHQISKNFPMRPVFQRATASKQKLYCFFSPGISRTFEIQQAIIFVNSTLTEKMLKTCLQEEIVQALGLFNDYSASQFYSFNNIVSPKQLTVFDKILLSSLYDRAYSAGSPSNPIAQQVIEYDVKERMETQFFSKSKNSVQRSIIEPAPLPLQDSALHDD